MLVPDMRAVPPPSLVERIPVDEMKQPLLMSSLSSPGAEIVTPPSHLPSESQPPLPSVVKNDAVSAPITPENRRQRLLPEVAVVGATASTSGYEAGTCCETSFAGSFPAATTIVTPLV